MPEPSTTSPLTARKPATCVDVKVPYGKLDEKEAEVTLSLMNQELQDCTVTTIPKTDAWGAVWTNKPGTLRISVPPGGPVDSIVKLVQDVITGRSVTTEGCWLDLPDEADTP